MYFAALIELLLQLDRRGIHDSLAIRAQLVLDVRLREGRIDVAHRDELFGLRQLLRVPGAHAAEADDGEVHDVARRPVSDAAQNVARNDHWEARSDRRAECQFAGVGDKIAPGNLLASHDVAPLMGRWCRAVGRGSAKGAGLLVRRLG